MNFEQLLDGATKGPWNAEAHPADRTVHIYGPAPDCRLVCELSPHSRFDQMQIDADAELIVRCNPSVMREVWAALKLANAPFTDHSDAELQLASEHIAMMTDDPEIHQKAKMAWAVRRALALLDGQQPTKEEM